MLGPGYRGTEEVGTLFAPHVAEAMEAGRQAGLAASTRDRLRTLLLLVDAQVDFVHEDGALAVPGAVADTARTIEWLYANAGEVTAIACSLDTHVPQQIFFSSWWSGPDGEAPPPFTPIAARDVDEGRWTPRVHPEWSRAYVHRLEEDARKELMIWPFHTMLGTPGHALEPSLYQAVAWHAAARSTHPTLLPKGSLPLTEHYSILEPEVRVPEDPRGMPNEVFLEEILGFDRIFVAGQARSHCVLETLRSVVRRYGDRPDLLGKFRLLLDCTSSVVHPVIDFDAMAMETLEGYAERGLVLTTSIEPL